MFARGDSYDSSIISASTESNRHDFGVRPAERVVDCLKGGAALSSAGRNVALRVGF